MCFDVSEIQTFINLPIWIGNVKDNCSNKDVTIYLLGNKCDVNQYVSQDKIEIFCKKYNLKFFETSSKDNIKIKSPWKEDEDKLKCIICSRMFCDCGVDDKDQIIKDLQELQAVETYLFTKIQVWKYSY